MRTTVPSGRLVRDLSRRQNKLHARAQVLAIGAHAALVLQGYYTRALTLSTASGYLGTQAKHVANIERAAFTGMA